MIRLFSAALLLGAAAASAQTAGDPPTDFNTAKAQVTARLQQELACVQAATTFEMLHACRPHPPGGHPPGPPPQDK